MEIPISGTIKDLPAADYHAHPAVGSTSLKKYRLPTAAHARHQIENPKDTGDDLLRGKVLHTLLLEPHRIDLDYVIEKEKLWDKSRLIKNGGSKETWDAMKKDADQRLIPIVPYDMYQQCLGMKASIEAHEHWQLVKDGQKELSVFSQLKNLPARDQAFLTKPEFANIAVKARPDILHGSVILDLKTSRHHITDKKIRSIIAELGYHISGAMYVDVCISACITVEKFYWIFVESFAPYLCRFVAATPKMLETGRREFYSCLEKHAECMKDKAWPGYPAGIPELDLPDWYSTSPEFALEGAYESDNSDEYDDDY